MARKSIKWSALDNANLNSSIAHFQQMSANLRDDMEYMQKLLGDTSLIVSSDNIASLVVSIRNASALLQVMISAKQLQEERTK